MIFLHSLMAIDAGMIALIAVAAILALAFIIGAVKGIRRVNKSGILWLTAGVGFAFVYKLLGENNLLKNMFTGNLASVADLAWAFLLVVGCVVAALLLGFLISIIFRHIPKDKAPVKKVKVSKDGEELSFEEASELADREKRARRRAKTYYDVDNEDYDKKIGFWSRFFGGFACLLNVLAYVAFIAIFALVLVKNSKLSGYIEPLLSNPTVNNLFTFASKYIFDIITVGIVMGVAGKGFDVGFVRTTRNIVRRLGMLAVVIAAFVLPFLMFFDQLAFVQSILGTLRGILPQWGAISDILSRVILGAGMAIVGVIIVALLNVLLRSLMYAIDDTNVARVIDGALAAVLYVVISVLVCLLVWGGVCILDEVKLLQIEEFIMETPSFAGECFTIAKQAFRYVITNYLGAII